MFGSYSEYRLVFSVHRHWSSNGSLSTLLHRHSDFVTFPNGVFSATIISTIIKNPTLQKTAEYQLLLGSLALPGAIIGAFLVRYTGTKYLLAIGFSGYIIFGLAIGLAWDKIIDIPVLFIILYGLLSEYRGLSLVLSRDTCVRSVLLSDTLILFNSSQLHLVTWVQVHVVV